MCVNVYVHLFLLILYRFKELNYKMASKRTFSEEDMDGKIVRIKLKDFL